MSFDFSDGNIGFAEIHGEYDAKADFRPLMHRRNVLTRQTQVHSKRMIVVKPKAKAKNWVAEAESAPIAGILKRLKDDIDLKYGHLSSLEPTLFSEEYMAVIGLGPRVLPLLLLDLRTGHTPWFWALKAITRENVGNDAPAGDFGSLRDAWLAWGAAKGLL